MPPTTRTSTPKAYPALTGFRFFTCLHVVLYHLFKPILAAAGAPTWMQNLLRASTFGFFFVLSGFLLGSAYAHKVADPESRNRFWRRRVARIVPLYLGVLAVAAPLRLAQVASHREGLAGWATAGKALLASLLMVQAWFRGFAHFYNAPAWSISVEMFLYAIFPFLVPVLRVGYRRFGLAGCFALLFSVQAAEVAWLVASPGGTALLGSLGQAVSYPHYFTSFNPLSWVAPFGMGVLLAFHHEQAVMPVRPLRAYGFLMLSAATFVALFLALAPTRWVLLARIGLFSIPFSLLIYGLARCGLERHPLLGALRSPVLQRLGSATYAMYLIHVPLFLILNLAWARATSTSVAEAGTSLGLGAAFLLLLPPLSVLVHERTEKPLTRAWTTRLNGGGERKAPLDLPPMEERPA